MNPIDWPNFNSARNLHNKLLKSTTRWYYISEIQNNQGDIKGTWKIINKLIHNWNKSSKATEIYNKEGEKIQGYPDSL